MTPHHVTRVHRCLRIWWYATIFEFVATMATLIFGVIVNPPDAGFPVSIFITLTLTIWACSSGIGDFKGSEGVWPEPQAGGAHGLALDAVISGRPWAGSLGVLDAVERAFILAKLGGSSADIEALVTNPQGREAILSDDGPVALRLRASGKGEGKSAVPELKVESGNLNSAAHAAA